MTLYIDGIPFDDARAYAQGSSYTSIEQARSQARVMSVDRFGSEGEPMSIVVPMKGANARRTLEQLQGIADRRGVVIVRSTRQKVWGNELEAYMAIKSFQPSEEGPFYYTGTITGEFQGTPRAMLASYRVISVQLENDFNMEGITTIPIPDGSTNVSHPTAAREGSYAVVNHADWDGGGYAEGATTRNRVTFMADPILFYQDGVVVNNAGVRIMGTIFSRSGSLEIRNGFVKLVIDFTNQHIEYWYKVAGTFVQKETFTLQAFTEFRLIVNENDYVAGQFDTGEVMELWRGKDVVFSNTVDGSFKWVTSAGTAASTSGSTNYLQIAASGVYVASQRHFELTAGKVIRQTGTPADARFLITATASAIATRAKEVLKRQA